MTYDSTRKQFFAKLLGMVGTASVLPQLRAKSDSAVTPSSSQPAAAAIEIRRDTRSVPRRHVA